MTLGESAGRSAGNTPRASARRRFNDQERAQATRLHDDPEAWPDEPKKTGMQNFIIDIIVAGAAAFFMLLMLACATFTTGWPSRVVYGCIIAAFSATAMIAWGSAARRRP